MKATSTRAKSFSTRSRSVKCVSSILKPLVFSDLNALCKALHNAFKKMKQNFQLHYFYGENENAIRTQVWCTLIAQLLLTVIQKIARTKKAFSVVASLVRIHLISMLDVSELLRSTKRDYQVARGSPNGSLQLDLFGAKTGGGHFEI